MHENKKLWIALVVLAAAARIIPHPWNFWPMIGLGLFAGAKAANVSIGRIGTFVFIWVGARDCGDRAF